ncbi:MAG TPA: glycoside hydrolase family 3 N-terminal domain-containing protein [Verrucomicrobiae bacterium]|nr:glycoside hydrolase family 3 N-terminal domain-containing protein [Verrucomicrobiae bacterium]
MFVPRLCQRAVTHTGRACICLGIWLGAGCIALWSAAAVEPPSNYDPQVAALLAQMTLDEKIGQMTQADSEALKDKSGVQKYFLGSVLSGGGHAPAENDAKGWLKSCDEFRSWALKTRLKIPLLYGVDAVHGHNNVDGAVIFPHNIGLGATRDPALVEKAARVVEAEVAGTGIQWAFAPCVAVARNECWGRTYESFGESTELVSELGAAEIRGLQGRQLSDPTSVLACAKHFVADGGTADGVDQGNALCDEATLRKVFLAPYVAAVKAGVGSIMVSYSSWNGQKMHGNKELLTRVLKGELGFEGFLVSDWAAIDQLSPNYKWDVAESINAGLDMVMVPNAPGTSNNYVEFIQDLKESVGEGKIPMSRIDDAVSRILRIKFQMGLFDKPYTDPELTAAVGSAEHREVARECVRESLVLLKNSDHALPLSKNLKHLHVMGQAADDIGMQCGGWTISWQGKAGPTIHGGTTILAAIRKTVAPDVEVTYSATGERGHGADAVLVVVGEMPYAEKDGDRKDLRLSATNAALIARAKQTGAPVITVMISGRPLILDSALAQSDALVEAWLPGTEGQGVADVLFGDYKPTGKLPRRWPLNNQQLSATAALNEKPLFPYGFGLSYDSLPSKRSTAKADIGPTSE